MDDSDTHQMQGRTTLNPLRGPEDSLEATCKLNTRSQSLKAPALRRNSINKNSAKASSKLPSSRPKLQSLFKPVNPKP